MKTLQDYIEEEKDKIYIEHLEDLMRIADLAVRCEVKNKEEYYETLRKGSRDLLNAFSLSLQRIAKITAKEIVLRPQEHKTPNTGNTYNQGKIEGYNHYFVALQAKIKEFGI